MKTIRKISQNPVLLVFVCLTVTLFSCGRESILEGTSKLSGKEMMRAIYFLDGPATHYIRPIQDGLKLDELFNDDEEIELIRSNINTLLDHIETAHRGIFESFKIDMTSKDHMVIKEALPKYASIIHEATKEVYKNNHLFLSIIDNGKNLAELINSHFPGNTQEDLSPTEVRDVLTSGGFRKDISNYFNDLDRKLNGTGRTESPEEQTCVIWFGAVAVAVIYVVAVLAAVALWTAGAVDWATETQSSDPSLLREQIVNDIATNF